MSGRVSHRGAHGLLERGREVERIGAGIEAACEGVGEVLMVEGPAGIGKSALLDAAAGIAAESEAGVFSARATELERELPFGVARQLLEPPLRAAPAEVASELLEGSATHAALALGLAEEEPAPGPAPGFATLNGLYWLVANLADREPLVICLDDAHWADPDSLRFLEFLAPRLHELPALLLCAARPEEWSGPTPLAATASDAAARPLRPAPLSEEATAELLTSRFEAPVDPRFAAACHAATGGNPFYLHTLVDELRADHVEPTADAAALVAELGPAAVTRTVVTRLARLGEDAAALARAVAVLGDGAEAGQAAALAGLEPGPAQEAAEGLAEAEVLADPGRRLSFAHPITRNAVYGDIGARERTELHRRAIALLREAGTAPEHLASHLLALPSASDPEVVEMLRQAARVAAGRGALDSAIAYLRRALEEPPRDEHQVEVLTELGGAETLTRGEAAIEHLDEAFGLAAEPQLRASIGAKLAATLFVVGRFGDSVEIATDAIEAVGEIDGDLRRVLEARRLISASMEPSKSELAREVVDRLHIRGTEGQGLGARSLAAALAFWDARFGAPASSTIARAESALADGLLIAEEDGGLGFVAAFLALTLADSERALPALAAKAGEAERNGDVMALTGVKLFGCLTHLLRGDLHRALADGEEARTLVRAYGAATPFEAAFLAAAQIECGRFDDAEQTLAGVSSAAQVPESWPWQWFLDSRCRLLAARGDLRRALEETLRCGRLFSAVGGRNPAFMAWRSRAALCLTGLGEGAERAKDLAAEEVALARACGAPRALGVALRAQGLVTGTEEGCELLREAVEVLSGSPARLEHARALVDLGAAIRRQGRRSEAREPLMRGLDLARSCGAVPLAERAYDELRATGARPRKIVRTGADTLTPSERRVADLAASGLSNREIAQRLFVTTKTVEFHLGQSYRKLEIESRAELSKVLESTGSPSSQAGDGPATVSS